jgi:signal transduction histidine kinase/ActR/RegA family two-component response regulator
MLRWWVPFALLSAGIALSIAAGRYVAANERARAEAQFSTEAREAAQQIQSRIESYLEVVRASGALLRASNEIPASEFRAFVAALRLNDRYPGLVGIGFAARASRRQLPGLLRGLRLEGSNIRIFPAGGRDEYMPIVLLEPRTPGSVRGYDIGTDPLLRDVMDAAADTGELKVSVNLPAPNPFIRSDGNAIAVMLQPIYRSRAAPGTIEERRRALVGFVLAPLNVPELIGHISQEITGVVFDVYDSTAASGPSLGGSPRADRGPYRLTQSVRVGDDRHWIVLVSSKAGPSDAVVAQAAERTQLVGISFSLLLFLISAVQIRAWQIAATHEAELRASEQALRKTESDLRTMVELERHARSEAQSASRAKDEFLTMISHELRTPLNAVVGWVSMLRSGAVREERHAHALETIERNARLQVQLIEDLLDISRLSMGKTRLDLRAVALDAVVAGVVDSLRPAAEARGLQLHTTIDSPRSMVRGDAARIQQIVWNLVSNAIKFTPPGGRVAVEISRDDARTRLVVQDTGIGIHKDFLPHVFERFRQADSSTTRGYGGIGLGLAIVRELVEMHGGTITVASEGEHHGSTFTVELPSAAAGQPIAPVLPATDAVPSLDGVRVLVVDDDQTTRELLCEALAAMHAKPLVAGSAPEAFERLTAEGADVVVSDIAMPDEDGLTLIRRIRELPGELSLIPAIALTAYARSEDRERALQAGFQRSLTKPVTLLELQQSIAELLNRAA